jgi:hypothetical protein
MIHSKEPPSGSSVLTKSYRPEILNVGITSQQSAPDSKFQYPDLKSPSRRPARIMMEKKPPHISKLWKKKISKYIMIITQTTH